MPTVEAVMVALLPTLAVWDAGVSATLGGVTVVMLYKPTSSTPKYQLSVPAWAKRSRTFAWLSASGRRKTSTRFDSTGLSSTLALMYGPSSAQRLELTPINAP